MTIAVAQFLKICDKEGVAIKYSQNYWINETVDGYEFAAFNVSALISSVSAGTETLSIELIASAENLDLVETGLYSAYIARVEQYQLESPAIGSGIYALKTLNAAFTGEFESVVIKESTITLSIGSNLDSTEVQVPPRTFTTTLAGNPPKL